jgi:DNA-binding LacI/PurR family transcriptional regulator
MREISHHHYRVSIEKCRYLLYADSCMTSRRVTLIDVARKLGVSDSTVSRALHNNPLLPLSTRKRIQKAARDMGYEPDPLLSALAAYRKAVQPTKYRGVLAFLMNRASRERASMATPFFKEAKMRAAELGYQLEPFWLKEKGMTSERMTQILRARNVSGILIGSEPIKHSLHLDWKYFSVVSAGPNLEEPRFNTVGHHQYRSMRILVKKIRTMRYRRPGLALPTLRDSMHDNQWSSAFLYEQKSFAPKDRIPRLLTTEFSERPFRSWFQQHQPDVVITYDFDTVSQWIQKLKKRIPRDVGLAAIAMHTTPFHSGMIVSPSKMGRKAIDFLVGMIHRQERGVPEQPEHYLIEPAWNRGTSLRYIS